MQSVIFEINRPETYQLGFQKPVRVLFNEKEEVITRKTTTEDGKSESEEITQYTYNYLEFDSKSITRDEFVTAYIRDRYSVSDEIAILRQRETKPAEYDAWYEYAEQAKSVADQLGLI